MFIHYTNESAQFSFCVQLSFYNAYNNFAFPVPIRMCFSIFQWCIDLTHFMEFTDVIKASLYADISGVPNRLLIIS